MREELEERDCGVIFQENIAVSYQKKRDYSLLFYGLEMVFAILLSYVMLMSFVSGVKVEVNAKIILIAVSLIGIVFYFTFSLKKGMLPLLVVESCIYAYVGFRYRKRIAEGMAILLNVLVKHISHYYGFELTQYEVSSSQEILDTSIFLIYMSVFFWGFIFCIVKNELSTFWLAVITGIYVFSPEIVGYTADFKYLLAYVFLILAYIASRSGKRKRGEKNRKNLKIIQGKVAIYLTILIGICTLIFVNAFSEKEYKVFTKDKSLKIAIQDGLRHTFDDFIRGTFSRGSVSGGISFGELEEVDKIEYSGDTMIKLKIQGSELSTVYLRGYIGSGYEDNQWLGLSKSAQKEKGRLEDISELSTEDYTGAMYHYYRTLLDLGEAVHSNEQQIDYSLYEKMYTGENPLQKEGETKTIVVDNVKETYGTMFTPYNTYGNLLYEKNGKLYHTRRKNKGLYSWNVVTNWKDKISLQSSNFSEENWAKNYKKIMKNLCDEYKEKSGKDIMQVDTGNLGGLTLGEHLNIFESSQGSEVFDGIYLELDAYSKVDAKVFIETLQRIQKLYIEEQSYESFVKKNYTQVPESIKGSLESIVEQKKEDWAFEDDCQTDWLEMYDIYYNVDKDWAKLVSSVMLVKEFLSKETSYTLSPGAVPEDKDFVEYFLFDNKKGYCVHYASSATLLLRTMGIPARYVEGYVAQSSLLKSAKFEDDYLNVELTDECAHAWVEVYVSGFGWVPVEVTPGYEANLDFSNKEDYQNVERPTTTGQPGGAANTQKNAKKPAIRKLTIPIIEKIKKIIGYIIVSIVMVVLIFLRRYVILRYRDKQEKTLNIKKKILFYYKEIDKLIVTNKYKKKEENLREWLLEARCEEVWGIEPERWEHLLTVINQMAFGNKEPYATEVEKVSNLYHELHINTYKNASKIKRLFYKYIKVL